MWSTQVLVISFAAIAGSVRASCPIRGRPLDLSERMHTGRPGLPSSTALALVLILPYELDYWWPIQSIAYGVVLFDLFLLAPFAPRLVSIMKSQAT